MHRLPGRIVAVVVATVLLFVVTTAVSILWMSRALDRQAFEQTQAQVEIARANLLARMRLITFEYTKWDAAYEAMRSGNVPWLLDNVGSAAFIGKTVNLVVAWGGALPADIGWTDKDGIEARTGVLPAEFLSEAEAAISGAVPGGFDGKAFFRWQGDDLYALGVSHVEAVENAQLLPEGERYAGQLILGFRVSKDVVDDIARSLTLTGAGIAREPLAGKLSLPLPGLGGEPVGYITWDMPRPGTTMLRRMLPFVSVVTAAAALLAFANMRLVRRSATELVRAERRASSAARTDALTGLPNRAVFTEALAGPARNGERAVLFLDLNGFKIVNDSLGHAAGDRVIVEAAERLSVLTGPDVLLARIAGDEFVFLINGSRARERVEQLAEAVDRTFDAPFSIRGHHLHLRAAIGYAVQDADDMPGEDLLRQADLAMYEGKRLSVGTPIAFRTMMEEAAQNAVLVERSLRAALALRPHEISVAYQPIVGMDGQFHHAEVLARWTSADHGSVPPARFVPVAEKAGLVIELGRLILAQVGRDLHAHPHLRVSVNISPLQLAAPEFIPDLLEELARLDIDPARIEVELTESVLVKDPILTARHLQELRAAGFRIALDDFGTGYSSISYLEQLPFDTLKIDRSFLSGARQSPKRQALLRAMIQMAHGLDLQVVCEGVETAAEMSLLEDLKCDLVQGFLFDRPMPLGEFAARWLGGRLGWAAA